MMTRHNENDDVCTCDADETHTSHSIWCPLSPEYREPPAPKNKHKAPKMKNKKALANDVQAFLTVFHPGARLGSISTPNDEG